MWPQFASRASASNVLNLLFPSNSQALVLLHLRAPIEERMPYHGIRLAPVKPVISMGSSAHVEPPIEVRMAVYAFLSGPSD